MKNIGNRILLAVIICVAAVFVSVLGVKQQLRRDVIRMHIIANSDSREDQNLKLLVRDQVAEYLQTEMAHITSCAEAKLYLTEHQDAICQIAKQTLEQAGCRDAVSVSVRHDDFPTRAYDNFSLPAGVYQTLRIELGDAQGKNWWCVVFPSLCFSSGVENPEDMSVFSDTTFATIQKEPGYEIHFFLLEWIGNIENFFWHK